MRACGSSRLSTYAEFARNLSLILSFSHWIEAWTQVNLHSPSFRSLYVCALSVYPPLVWVPLPNACMNDTIVSVHACVRVFKGDEAFHVWLPSNGKHFTLHVSFCQPAAPRMCVRNMLWFSLFSTNFTTSNMLVVLKASWHFEENINGRRFNANTNTNTTPYQFDSHCIHCWLRRMKCK